MRSDSGAVKGAVAGSGVGLPLAVAADFTAGTIGSMAEQAISEGAVDAGKSVAGGLTNAVNGLIYGNDTLRSLGEAAGRGAFSGMFTSGINYLADVMSPQPASRRSPRIQYQGGAAGMPRPRDPKKGCVPSDPTIGSLRYGRDYGYQYNVPVSNEDDQSRRGFSPVDFVKEMLTGAAFYGAGRAVSALKESIKSGSKYDLYRKESNTGSYKDLEELMQLKNVKNVANKAGVGLDGVKVKIDRNPELLGRNVYGYTDGKTITLYPDAFTNTETLVRTLGHERMHVYQVGVFGKPTSTDILGEFERGASMSEQSWWDYFNFRNGGQ